MYMSKLSSVKQTHFHDFYDSQGFGTYAPEVDETPNHVIFMKCGELFSKYRCSYDIHVNGACRYVKRPFYHGDDTDIAVNHVEAWGFGDENELCRLVLSNRTNSVQTVSLEGCKLKPEWSYGGEIERILPDFMVNREYTRWLSNRASPRR